MIVDGVMTLMVVDQTLPSPIHYHFFMKGGEKMLQIGEFDYIEENDCYFANACFNGVEFGILVDTNAFKIEILGNISVSADEMDKKVKPYFDVIAECVAKKFGLI